MRLRESTTTVQMKPDGQERQLYLSDVFSFSEKTLDYYCCIAATKHWAWDVHTQKEEEEKTTGDEKKTKQNKKQWENKHDSIYL